jgi:hypothetical protein
MSAQKTLSQLSFAAIVLLIAAIPSFAQTDTSQTSAASMTDGSSVVAVNRESVTRESRTEAKTASNADTKTKAQKLSADMFVKAASESPVVNPKPSFEPIAVPARFERKQGPVNGVTFVLSRGQKLPE